VFDTNIITVKLVLTATGVLLASILDLNICPAAWTTEKMQINTNGT
jgi:hypothetical protein